MEIITKQMADDELLIIVYSLNQNYIPEGYNPVLEFSTGDSLSIEELAVSDPEGNPVLALTDELTDIDEIEDTVIDVEQNYPNPFQGITRISYTLNEDAIVSFTVYNVQGQEVYTTTRKKQSPGSYSFTWNGLNNNGELIPGGIYLYRVSSKHFSISNKMLLIR